MEYTDDLLDSLSIRWLSNVNFTQRWNDIFGYIIWIKGPYVIYKKAYVSVISSWPLYGIKV